MVFMLGSLKGFCYVVWASIYGAQSTIAFQVTINLNDEGSRDLQGTCFQ